MRAEARRDDAIAASCLLAALGQSEPENEAETVRTYTGALLIVDALRELTDIRRLLTVPESDK